MTPKGSLFRRWMTEASTKRPHSELLYVIAYTLRYRGAPLLTKGGALKQDNTTDIVMCPTGNSKPLF
jgi:hypothetical protein